MRVADKSKSQPEMANWCPNHTPGSKVLSSESGKRGNPKQNKKDNTYAEFFKVTKPLYPND